MNKDEVMQIFNGVMLGDGGLRMWGGGAVFQMGLCRSTISMSDHLKWLQYIKDECFELLGVSVSSGYPRVLKRKHTKGSHKGEPYYFACLSTRQSGFLAEQYRRWYALTGEWVRYNKGGRCRKGDTKVLPDDLVLAPIVLTHWFLGDGSSYWTHLENKVPQLRMAFSTECFTREGVGRLTDMLNHAGITTIKPGRHKVIKGSGLEIRLSQQSVSYLAGLVEPHIMEVFGGSEGPSYKDMIKRKSNPPPDPIFDTLRARLKGG